MASSLKRRFFRKCGRNVNNGDIIKSKPIFLKDFGEHHPACQIWSFRGVWFKS